MSFFLPDLFCIFCFVNSKTGIGASIRLLHISLLTLLDVDWAIVLLGGVVCLSLFRCGFDYVSGASWQPVAWLVCGSVALVGMASAFAGYALAVTIGSASFLWVFADRRKKEEEDRAVMVPLPQHSEHRSQLRPTSLSQLSSAMKELPLVGDREKLADSLFDSFCRKVDAPFSVLVLQGERGIG